LESNFPKGQWLHGLIHIFKSRVFPCVDMPLEQSVRFLRHYVHQWTRSTPLAI